MSYKKLDSTVKINIKNVTKFQSYYGVLFNFKMPD